jgi:hypothetical protein
MSTPATLTAFAGSVRLAAGPLADIWPAVRAAARGEPYREVLVFDDASGRVVDLDLNHPPERLVESAPVPGREVPRGRPRLGVVAREVTLLPRHWEWLGTQPGGASAALRRLVDAARRAQAPGRDPRAAQEAAYRFLSAIAGDFRGYEEALRALFADDRGRFARIVADWPADIRAYALRLGFGEAAAGG